MKTISLVIVQLLLSANLLIAAETLDQLLDLRIEVNEKYRDQYTEEAAESPYAKKLQPLQKKLGQEWVDYLTYVKNQKDDKLKAYVIRLELLDEIAGCYYDLEYAETMMEKASIKNDMLNWQKQLDSLNSIVGAGSGDQSTGSPETKPEVK